MRVEQEKRQIEIEQEKLLVVEGADDARLFKALMRYIGVSGIQVLNVKGKDNIRKMLKVISSSPGYSKVTSIGVVRDADANAGSALQSVQDALRDANLPSPDAPLSLAGDDLRVAVLIAPHGKSSGAIEDVCLESVAGDAAMGCAQDYLNCIKDSVAESEQPNNLRKARLQAFLASRKQPGKRLSEAAEAGYWDFEHTAFEPFKRLLGML